jgi:hypothetical protein
MIRPIVTIMTEQILDRAPDFAPGYPSKGGLIGPAWQDMWDSMRDGRWKTTTQLAELVPSIQRKTVLNLLRAARKAGKLEVRYGHAADPRMAQYRRTDAWTPWW